MDKQLCTGNMVEEAWTPDAKKNRKF